MFCLSGAGHADVPGVEERLQVYVDERMEQLRTELMGLLENQSKSTGSVKEASTSVNKGISDKPAVAFSSDHLDQQDMHGVDGSIWDSVILIGLDCLGPGESLAVFLLLIINCIVQIYFCVIVMSGPMVENPLKDEMMDELLRFRTSVAHKVEYADSVSGRSLLSQVCSTNRQLHISGSQQGLFEDLESFGETGLALVLLALLCWSASIVAELNSTVRFAMAVWQKRGQSTRITLQPDASWDGRFVLESLSSLDVAKVFVLGIAPRVMIAGFLYVVGAIYLSVTTRLEDLLLNAMALAFIMDVDELFFSAFMPHRAKTLIRGLAPLLLRPLSHFRRKRFERVNRIFGGSLEAMLRLLLLLVALLFLYFGVLWPFHQKLGQAMDILCGGNRDFVYSSNPASGMVVAAHSRKAGAEDTWAAAECVALQLSMLTVQEGVSWSPAKTDCNETFLLRPSDKQFSVHDPRSLEEWRREVDFTWMDFEYVSSLARDSVQQATVNARCTDVVSDTTVLEDAVGGLVVAGDDGVRLQCADVKGVCHLQNMTRVRALCPKTCECDLWGFSAAGLFKTPYYGCPDQCIVAAVAAEERWRFDGNYSLECMDFTRTKYYFPGRRSMPHLTTAVELLVMDGNVDGNITFAEVNLGFMRHFVDEKFWAIAFLFDLNEDWVWDESEQAALARAHDYVRDYDIDDDSVLSAAEIQAMENSSAFVATYVDANSDGAVTVAEMAGYLQDPGKAIPAPPTRITIRIEDGARLFLLGLKEYMLSRPNWRKNLESPVESLGDHLNLNRNQRRDMFDFFASGNFVDGWLNGEWVLGPGILHPREFVWCEFITSWEINLLLGLSVCNHDVVASTRTFCPESCNCQAQMTDCPSSCPNVHKLGLALV